MNLHCLIECLYEIQKGGLEMIEKRNWIEKVYFSIILGFFILLFNQIPIFEKIDFQPIRAKALNPVPKTGFDYTGRPVDEETGEPIGSPSMIWFLPSAGNYFNYYNRPDTPKNLFYEEYYQGMYHWYSMVPRPKATAREAFMGDMYDNRQLILGAPNHNNNYRGGDFLVDPRSNLIYRYNIKLGKADPRTGIYQGPNTGTQKVTLGPYRGKNYEWRYLGYSWDGNVVPNPFFPADYYSPNTVWKNLNWVVKSWTTGNYQNFEGTFYDSQPDKVKWIKEYFLKSRPNFRRTGNIDADARWWADRLSLRTDPEKSAGILQGWHIDSNGHHYYVVFVMDSPKQPNLRITEFKVTKKGNSVANAYETRHKTSFENFKETEVYNNVNGKSGKYIQKNETYVLEAKVRNMDHQDLKPFDTTHTPLNLDLLIGFDDTTLEHMGYDTEIEEYCPPVDPNKTTIKYGEEVAFRCEVEIPSDEFEKYIELGLRINNEFFKIGENTMREDDISQITFEPMPEDMILQGLQIIDENGSPVDAVVPHQRYGAIFNVKKNLGVIDVGDPSNLAKNPFATVNVYATDNGSVLIKDTVVADKTLKLNETVKLRIDDLIKPRTSQLKVCGEISYKHDEAKLNIRLPENHLNTPLDQKEEGDDFKCQEIISEVNVSVSDFIINPPRISLPYGQYSTNEDLQFSFTLNYRSDAKIDTSIEVPVVLKKGNTIIRMESIHLYLNEPYEVMWEVPNVYLHSGNNEFTVEVNPHPRYVFEWLKGNKNPYADNIAKSSVYVETNAYPTAVCNAPHTENYWTQVYNIREKHGYWESDPDGGGGCRTTWRGSWTESYDLYETYEITNVLFRSKLTEDTQGGWIDIMNQPGRVKAGYGFEIKVVAKYKTNFWTHKPSPPWSSTCSYRRVNPWPTTVNPASHITITMPFKDKAGNKMKYNISGETSGPWYNETQVYEMPMRNAFGLKNTREIFVNETAKDGTYEVRIDTLPFYGTNLSPNASKKLCDRVFVDIEIVGSNKDDVNTHITQ